MKEREKILIRTSWVSVIGNAILSASKICVGIFAGSLAVLGDGIDSATDVVISLVTLFTARIISRPPNLKYPYGYEKADSVATKILSFIILFAGFQMLISTGKTILYGEEREMPGTFALFVTVFSIIGKLLLAYYQFRQGKKANSAMLIANAKNMRNDVLISSGVLLGLLFTFVLGLPILDSITGLLISVYIIKSAIDIFMETNVVLMDGVKDPLVYEKIFEAAEKVPGSYNPHRVRVRQIGSLYMIELDIEVDGNLPLKEAHAISHKVEESIKDTIGNIYDIVIHTEPRGERHSKEEFGVSKEAFLKLTT